VNCGLGHWRECDCMSLRADFSGNARRSLMQSQSRKRDVPPTVYSGTQNNLPDSRSSARRLACGDPVVRLTRNLIRLQRTECKLTEPVESEIR
jgi:hypothetical protein